MKPFSKIPNKLIFLSKLDVYEHRVLCILLSLKPSRPSYKNLMHWTGLSRDKVYRVLKSLKSKNIINWKSGNSHRKSNFYFVVDDNLWFKGTADNSNSELFLEWETDSQKVQEMMSLINT